MGFDPALITAVIVYSSDKSAYCIQPSPFSRQTMQIYNDIAACDLVHVCVYMELTQNVTLKNQSLKCADRPLLVEK